MDPVQVQIFHHLLAAIPEEMGAVLRRAASSPNIKERLDFSCALTGPGGAMVAQASHIPVHLGSVHLTARHLLREAAPGDGHVLILNDPWRGGTHLPDITLFAPVRLPGRRRVRFGVLVRAHHADVGGAQPGSMGLSRDIHGEGLLIPPVPLRVGGRMRQEVLDLVLANSRTPGERLGDLRAQLAAVDVGRARLLELARRRGVPALLAAVAALHRHAAEACRRTLRLLRDGVYRASARLDGPGTPRLAVIVTKRGERLECDFRGSDDQVDESFNANEAITLSCVFYVVRLLLGRDLPTNSGVLDPITVRLRPGSVVAARRPAPVAGGNVETSQRIVDLLLAALAPAVPGRIPASSQGTMNNVTLGGRGRDGAPFTFYETLAGGAGAGPGGPGASGIHTHMTNTLNTPVEALEHAIPVLLRAYRLRTGSGGRGRHPGGEGLERAYEARVPMEATVLATRRRSRPDGRAGGGPGAAGEDRIRPAAGAVRALPEEGRASLGPGDVLLVRTPGGGGFGRPPARRRRLARKARPVRSPRSRP